MNGSPGSPVMKTLAARMTSPRLLAELLSAPAGEGPALRDRRGREPRRADVDGRAALGLLQSSIARGDGDKDMAAVVEQFRAAAASDERHASGPRRRRMARGRIQRAASAERTPPRASASRPIPDQHVGRLRRGARRGDRRRRRAPTYAARGDRAVPHALRRAHRGARGRARGCGARRDGARAQAATRRRRAAAHHRPAAPGRGRGDRRIVGAADDRHEARHPLDARADRAGLGVRPEQLSVRVQQRVGRRLRRGDRRGQSGDRQGEQLASGHDAAARAKRRSPRVARHRPAAGDRAAPLSHQPRRRRAARRRSAHRRDRLHRQPLGAGSRSRRPPTPRASRSISSCRASIRSSSFPARSRSGATSWPGSSSGAA